jgi:hypothetical protein
MIRRLLLPSLSLLALVAGLALQAPTAIAAPQVWSGRTYAFSKAAGADPYSAAAEDRITPGVWITRGNTQGLYNIAQETFSGGPYGASPTGTEWATGNAVDYATLSFDTWAGWAGSFPPSTVGINAVVHLITEDIYIDIRFDSWGSGLAGGGAFSYHRAVAPLVVPTRKSTWGSLKELYR